MLSEVLDRKNGKEAQKIKKEKKKKSWNKEKTCHGWQAFLWVTFFGIRRLGSHFLFSFLMSFLFLLIRLFSFGVGSVLLDRDA